MQRRKGLRRPPIASSSNTSGPEIPGSGACGKAIGSAGGEVWVFSDIIPCWVDPWFKSWCFKVWCFVVSPTMPSVALPGFGVCGNALLGEPVSAGGHDDLVGFVEAE